MDARQRQTKLSQNYTYQEQAIGHQNERGTAAENVENFEGEKLAYLEMVQLTLRLHARLMSVIKLEMDKKSIPLNGVQALLLYHIGEGEITAGELSAREHYLGSNASYNLKKLTQQGWLINKRSKTDRRAVRIRLTEEGRKIYKIVDGLFQRHLEQIKLGEGKTNGFSSRFPNLSENMQAIDRLWHDQILYQL